MRKHAVGQEDWLDAAKALQHSSQIVGIAMPTKYGTVEEHGGIYQTTMRAIIHQGMGVLAGKRLRHHQVRRVAVGCERRALRAKEFGEA